MLFWTRPTVAGVIALNSGRVAPTLGERGRRISAGARRVR